MTVHFAHPHVAISTRGRRYRTTRMSIAYRLDDDGLRFGITFCGDEDAFSRKVGRERSAARLTDEPLFIPNVKGPLWKMRHLIETYIETSHSMPHRPHARDIIIIPPIQPST